MPHVDIYENRRDESFERIDRSELAAIIDDDIEDTAARFKNPYARGDQAIIARATAFYNVSANIKTELVEAGLE
jgi:hypothetical protein